MTLDDDIWRIKRSVEGTPVRITDSVGTGIRGCSLKKRYPTKASAKRAARATARKFQKNTSVYRCRFCGAWHVKSRRR